VVVLPRPGDRPASCRAGSARRRRTPHPTLAGQPAAAPIRLHPDNPHYFLWGGRPTILITSGEHYGAVLNLDFDYRRYLDELKAHRFNLTLTFSGTYREVPGSFTITGNTLAPAAGRFVCPWARSENPGGADGGNKFDLTRWDPAYFERLKDFLTQAGERGILVELVLFCTMYDETVWIASAMNARNNVNGVGEVGPYEVYSGKNEKLLAAQCAVVRLNHHHNRVVAFDETGGSDRSDRKYRTEGRAFILAIEPNERMPYDPVRRAGDGLGFTLVFTGGGNGKDNDSLNTVRGTFELRDRPHRPPAGE
jgi:hypothetical protein